MPSIEQIRKLADELKLEPALVQAVCEVEANGSGFLPAGAKSPAGRIVAGLLSRDDVRRIHGDISDILYERWGAKPYGSTNSQWDRLERARAICRPAADESASWGIAQVMGFHWQALGWPSIDAFVQDMHSYDGQLVQPGSPGNTGRFDSDCQAHGCHE